MSRTQIIVASFALLWSFPLASAVVNGVVDEVDARAKHIYQIQADESLVYLQNLEEASLARDSLTSHLMEIATDDGRAYFEATRAGGCKGYVQLATGDGARPVDLRFFGCRAVPGESSLYEVDLQVSTARGKSERFRVPLYITNDDRQLHIAGAAPLLKASDGDEEFVSLFVELTAVGGER